MTSVRDIESPSAVAGAALSQTDVVLQGIKSMITSGQLAAGARLPVEKDLALTLGVSRGSLREGVRALCIMGVLETRQGDGTYVTSLDSSLLLAPMGFMIDMQTAEHRRDLHGVRRILESEAAARAALHITDDQLSEAQGILESMRGLVFADPVVEHPTIIAKDVAFHHVIAKGADNGALAALIDALADRTFGARLTIGEYHEEQIRRSYDEHTAILGALRQHEPDRARLLMSHHLLTTEDFIGESQDADEKVG